MRPSLTLLASLFCVTFLWSCNDANFSAGAKKKSDDPKPAKTGDANPNDPSKEVNCTGVSEDACKAMKPTPDTKTFREVNCAGKAKTECNDAQKQERQKDGDLGSDIRVNGDPTDEGGKGGTPSDDITDGDGIVKKGKFFCIGGLGHNVSYVVKTKALADACIAFGNSHPCQNDTECGNVSKAPLVNFNCTCNNEAGIPFVKTDQCYRNNPLKGGVKPTGCVAN